jgi:predicted nuclease of predicted toxin-antitoxin system
MRLKLDENMPTLLATTLRNAGHDVHTAADENLLGKSDDEVWVTTRREGRLLVTLDRDFGQLAAGGGEHAGAIVLRPRDAEQTAIVSLAGRAVQLAAEIDMKNRVAIVEDERVRIRPPLAIIPPQEPT